MGNSINDLREKEDLLSNELADLPRGCAEYKEKMKAFVDVRSKLNKINQTLDGRK